MGKKLLVACLAASACQLAGAAPLYQWTDKDGSTRMTVQAPPPHATHVRKMLQADLPPMNDQSATRPDISAASILIPQDPQGSSSKRRLYESMRASEKAEERYMQDMRAEEARAEYQQRLENEYYDDVRYDRYSEPYFYEPSHSRLPPSISAAPYNRKVLSIAGSPDETYIPGGKQSIQAIREASELTGKAIKTTSQKPATKNNAHHQE